MATDRPDQPYGIYSTAFDREIAAFDVEVALAESGVRRGLPKNRKIASLLDRRASADQEFSAAIASNDAAILKSSLIGLADKLSLCLLIDQSGSMAEKLPTLAGQIKAAANLFVDCQVDFAIFGFTTMGWQGGMARQVWIQKGRPVYPGRLCSLLHIVYCDFGEALEDQQWQVMLDPAILFENIDGEALQWAAAKLEQRSFEKKLLVVLSDGAPVDDSTLQANGPNILMRHLAAVVNQLESNDSVHVAAIGSADPVDLTYRNSVQIGRPDEFLAGLCQLLSRLPK